MIPVLMTQDGRFETLAAGYGLVEGPRALPDGSVVFADVVGGGIHRVTPGGEVEVVLAGRRGVGGLAPHAGGGLVASGRDLVLDGETVLAAPVGVAGFNDLGVDDDGAVLAGALRFRPMAGEAPVPGEVWRLRPGGVAEQLLHGVLWPNGIGFSPAADSIYVSDFATGEVLVFDPDGGGRRRFAALPDGRPDGLAVDAEGGVWVALGPAGAVARLEPAGALDALLDVPAEFVASVAFAPDGMLLVATAGALLRTHVGVAGRPVAPARV